MKYDLTKCNNLRWECGDETDKHHGFCRVFTDQNEDDTISLIEMTPMPHGLQREYNFGCLSLEEIDKAECIKNLRIIPRNPETYTDWQVGDVVSIDEFDEIDLQVVVAARINDIVICNYIKENMVFGMFTCEELKKKGSLVLTDYEKELAGESKYMFTQGDKVLARDTDEDGVWYAGKFYGMSEFDDVPYSVCLGFEKKPYNFPECIPYNEKTWRLLGTTDNYEEE